MSITAEQYQKCLDSLLEDNKRLADEKHTLQAEIDRLKDRQGVQWISVKDRLPEVALSIDNKKCEWSDYVFVCGINQFGDLGCDTDVYDFAQGIWLCVANKKMQSVTHWAELNLPKAEK